MPQLCAWVSALLSDTGVAAHQAVAESAWATASGLLESACRQGRELIALSGLMKLAMASPVQKQSKADKLWETEWLQV